MYNKLNKKGTEDLCSEYNVDDQNQRAVLHIAI